MMESLVRSLGRLLRDSRVELHDRDEAILKYVAVRRWGRVGMYSFLSAAGVSSSVYPAVLVSDEVGTRTVVLLSLALTLGGFVCFVGAVTDRWLAEYSALPVLSLGLVCFGVAVIKAVDSDTKPLIAVALLVISFSFGLAARWKDVRAISLVGRASRERQEKTAEG